MCVCILLFLVITYYFGVLLCYFFPWSFKWKSESKPCRTEGQGYLARPSLTAARRGVGTRHGLPVLGGPAFLPCSLLSLTGPEICRRKLPRVFTNLLWVFLWAISWFLYFNVLLQGESFDTAILTHLKCTQLELSQPEDGGPAGEPAEMDRYMITFDPKIWDLENPESESTFCHSRSNYIGQTLKFSIYVSSQCVKHMEWILKFWDRSMV